MQILGIRVDEYDMIGFLCRIEEYLQAFAGNIGGLRQVITLNAEGIYIARQDVGFGQLIEGADLITPDGTGVVWAAAQYGYPAIERVTGIDLLDRICAMAAEKGWSVFMLGAKPGVAAAAAAKLTEKYPGLIIAGTENGYFRDREHEVIATINKQAPHILFAGLGMPFQEQWIDSHKQHLAVGVAIGVGGSFDVISGNLRRAPMWMQRLRLEWLYRLLQEPSRWRRFLALPKFMLAVHKDKKRACRQ